MARKYQTYLSSLLLLTLSSYKLGSDSSSLVSTNVDSLQAANQLPATAQTSCRFEIRIGFNI